ncbi:MAG: glycosyltransferase family 2 protein [Candidatus Aminicenantes bacterium]|nr:glycosyltransferase family 2 protein [Candidatus Aminicenantes bacterium]
MADIKFSIVILTHNSIGIVNRLVDALVNQVFNHGYEVIFMDNSSTDDTVAYLEKTPFKNKRIFNVPQGEFSHSGTRMKAAKAARGQYMIFFTDDIIPSGRDFLENLTAPVLQGRAVAAYGVYQIDGKTCDPIDAYLHNDWYLDFDEITEPISQFCWNKFPPELRRRLCNFDNCSSCIEREVLLSLEFPAVPYGEDMLFAKKLLLNNHSIAISKGARFYHWHKVSFTYLLRRMCIDQHLSIPEFGIYYVRRKLGVIKAIAVRVVHRTLIAFFKVKTPFFKRFYWAFYNIKTLTADFIGKYMGVLDENSVKGFSPLNKRLLRKKNRYVDEIYKKSIKRY